MASYDSSKKTGELEQFPAREKPTVSSKELLDRIKGLGVSISGKVPKAEDTQEKKAHIAEEHGEFVLYTKDGSRVLGRHPSREKAEAQERAIEASKHAKAAYYTFIRSTSGEGCLKKANVLHDLVAQIQKTTKGRSLVEDLEKNKDRAPAALDVLHGSSAAIPEWALRAGVGGAAGYLGGGAVGSAITPEIDPRLPEGEAEAIHGKRDKMKHLGMLLGAITGASTAEGAPENIEKVRQQFALGGAKAATAVNPKFGQLPEPQQQQATQFGQFLGQHAQAIPTMAGAALGGLGGLLNGSPISGALTGAGTGAGLTGGLMAGTALSDKLFPSTHGNSNDDWKRLLTTLGVGGLGAYAGNKLTGALVHRDAKKHEQYA